MTTLLKAVAGIALCLALTAAPAAAQHIYVPNYPDGTVTEIDPATNQISATINVYGPDSGECLWSPGTGLTCPEGVAIAGGLAYVSLDQSDRVAVINLGDHSVTYAGVPWRSDPLIYYEPARNRIYVSSCGWDNSAPTFDDERLIAVLDAADGSLLDTLETNGGVWGMGFSPDGQYAYGVRCGALGEGEPENSLLKINVDTDAVTTIELTLAPNGVAVSPTGALAILTGNECIIRVNLLFDTEDGTACGNTYGWYGADFNADGSRAYATDNGTGELLVIDPDELNGPVILSRTVVDSPGLPADLEVVGTRAYVLACEECYGALPSHVVEFDITTDNPSQLCSIQNGNGGLDIGVHGVPVWDCGVTPPDDGAGKKVHGEGRVGVRTDFEVNAQRLKKGLKGECHVNEHPSHGSDRKIQCVSVTSLTIVGNMAIIEGEALDSALPKKQKTLYRIEVTDNSKHGRNQDEFEITTTSGYAAGGVISKGNVWIK